MTRPEPQRSGFSLRSRPRSRAVAAMLAVFFAALAAVWVDTRLKSSPDAGFLLKSATWQIEAPDLPGAWEAWHALEASEAMRSASPALHNDLPLAIRRMTGIRPTPGRLRLWLGHHFLAGGNADGWCLSVRPGIAMRLTSWFRGPLAPAVGDVWWQNYVHGWRDGFLLIASSPDYLDRVLNEGQAVARGNAPRDEVHLRWAGPLPGTMRLRAAADLPVEFTLAEAASEDTTLHYAAGWTEAILAVNMRDDSPLADAGKTVLQWAEALAGKDASAPWRTVFSAWWQAYCPVPLPRIEAGEWALGIFGADFAPDIPTLETVWAHRGVGPSPLEGLALDSRREHRWNDASGWLIPVPGDSRVWAAANHAGTAYLASHEQRMPAVLATAFREPESGLAAITWRWKPVVEAVRGAVMRAARDGLLAGFNEEDAAAIVLPYVDAFGAWGTFQLHAKGTGGAIAVEGWLARGAGGGP